MLTGKTERAAPWAQQQDLQPRSADSACASQMIDAPKNLPAIARRNRAPTESPHSATRCRHALGRQVLPPPLWQTHDHLASAHFKDDDWEKASKRSESTSRVSSSEWSFNPRATSCQATVGPRQRTGRTHQCLYEARPQDRWAAQSMCIQRDRKVHEGAPRPPRNASGPLERRWW